MKKQNLKSLRLNKKSISDLSPQQITGGVDGSLARCSEVMSCITYTRFRLTCVSCPTCESCISIQLCFTRNIPCNQQQQ
jgi:hypothetical protein